MSIKLSDKIELTSLHLTLEFSNLVDLILEKLRDGGDVDVMSECRDKVVRMFKEKGLDKNEA